MGRRHDLLGVILVIAGSWLNYDVASTLSVHSLGPGWQFCLPYFVICLDSGHWTLAYDMGIGLILAGAYLLRFDGHVPHVPPLARGLLVPALVFGIAVGVLVVLLLATVDPLRFVWG